jgi:XisH protein
MAARDVFHGAVKQGLIKDGWTITHDPLVIRIGKRNMLIDLAAENLLAASREDQNIAVEIKSFTGPSDLEEFHSALGQFLNYRIALQDKRPEYKLFLAVPLETYRNFFQELLPRKVIEAYEVSLIVYDSTEEAIVSWIK